MYEMYKIYEMYKMYEMYEMYEIYEMYEMYKMYRSILSRPVSPLILLTHDGTAAQKRFRLPPTVSTHDGLTYDRANSSALQATTSHNAHG